MDERTDVAVIKIDGKNLPIVRIGDPATAEAGPVGGRDRFALRHGEQRDRRHRQRDVARSLPDDPNYVPFIQTDVAVNPGQFRRAAVQPAVARWSASTRRSTARVAATWACRSRFPIDVANDVRAAAGQDRARCTRGRIGVQHPAGDGGARRFLRAGSSAWCARRLRDARRSGRQGWHQVR